MSRELAVHLRHSGHLFEVVSTFVIHCNLWSTRIEACQVLWRTNEVVIAMLSRRMTMELPFGTTTENSSNDVDSLLSGDWLVRFRREASVLLWFNNRLASQEFHLVKELSLLLVLHLLVVGLGQVLDDENLSHVGHDGVGHDACKDPPAIAVVLHAILSRERQQVEESAHSAIRWKEDHDGVKDKEEHDAPEERIVRPDRLAERL